MGKYFDSNCWELDAMTDSDLGMYVRLAMHGFKTNPNLQDVGEHALDSFMYAIRYGMGAAKDDLEQGTKRKVMFTGGLNEDKTRVCIKQ